MTLSKALFIFMPILFCLTSANAETAKLKTVFSGKIPWPGSYSVILEAPTDWDNPGDYTNLSIIDGKKKVFELTELQAVGIEVKNVRHFPKGTKNLGKYLKMIPLDKEGKVPALALENWMGGSNEDQLILLTKESDAVHLVFRESVIVEKIEAATSDGKMDVFTIGHREEAPGMPYDPFLVYKQIRKDGKIAFEIDDELSKKWSAQNHYEWHGNKTDERIIVDKNGRILQK